MEQIDKIDPLVEWAVWSHLDSKTDLELILLKGHLLLEQILETVLNRKNLHGCEDYSFHRKIITLDMLILENELQKHFIISSLRDLNKLRNKLAHEFHVDLGNGDLQIWASNILNNLKGEKFTNYTYRTKIVHSFSVLSKNLLELKN